LSFEGARACEARVWSFFSKVTSGMGPYLNYAQGYNLTNRMPLFVKPDNALSVPAVISLMRDHYEGTWFDFSTRDVGATAFEAPYRWRPLDFKVGQNTYVNERAISTQQTGFTFVAQMRSFMPNAIGGVSWFGVDDSAMTVHAPIYCGITQVPNSLQKPSNAPGIMSFSFNSAFWVFNLVSNWVYTRYSLIYPEVRVQIEATEASLRQQAARIEQQFVEMNLGKDPHFAAGLLTNFSVLTFDRLTKQWLDYFSYLFVKYMDGNVKTPNPQNPYLPKIVWPGYGAKYQQMIVDETGDHYMVPTKGQIAESKAHRPAPSKQEGRARKL